jgi:DNA-binding phage protein
MNKEKTKVLFLAETDENNNSSTLAVFPDIKEGRGMVQCFSHAEGHSQAAVEYYKSLKQQDPPNYSPLLQGLVSLGYNLEVLNTDMSEPIKCAITSPTDGRIIIVYKDG